MKRYIIVTLTIALLFAIAGCGAAEDASHEDPSLTYVLEASEEPPSLTPDPEEAPERVTLDLVGDWVFSHFTQGDNDTPQPWFYEHFTPALIIRSDNTFLLLNYGSVEGDMVQTGDCQLIGTNLVASSEGYTWYPEDAAVWFTYHVESGLLQYTFFNEYGPFYFNIFFARAPKPVEL